MTHRVPSQVVAATLADGQTEQLPPHALYPGLQLNPHTPLSQVATEPEGALQGVQALPHDCGLLLGRHLFPHAW
jgi:hypothetical protein